MLQIYHKKKKKHHIYVFFCHFACFLKNLYNFASSNRHLYITKTVVELQKYNFMKKLLLNSFATVLVASAASQTQAGVPNKVNNNSSKRILIEQRTYGSSNGYVPSDKISKNKRFFYNTSGYVVGEYNEARRATKEICYDDFTPTSINKYTFGEQGYPALCNSYQWTTNNYEDNIWQFNSATKYEYDENGRLIYEGTNTTYTEYTYDENGNLVNKSEYITSTKQLRQSITYSDFDENGNPCHASSTGSYDNLKYEVEMTYDENGNKIEALTYNVVDDPENPGDKINKKQALEEWTYSENGLLSLYMKSTYDSDGNVTPSSRTTYESVDGNNNEIRETYETYMDGIWTKSFTLPIVNVYADFSGKEENTAMTLEASLDEKLQNTVDLTMTMPSLANLRKSQIIIYRDCTPIDTVLTTDILDPKTGKCVYQDKGVANGSYTYFVQPTFSTKSNPYLPGEEKWESFYVSNAVDVELNTELPAVTDLKLGNAEVKEPEGLFGDDTYFATLSWKNPEDADKYGFIANCMYFDIAKVAEKKINDLETTEYTKQFYRDTECYVVTKYAIGNAVSDKITVTIEEIKNFGTNGIGSVTAKGVTDVTFSGKAITLGENANITVFSTDGQKVCSANNSNGVSLENLPSATYIICVEKGGKVNAYKIQR